MASSVDLKLPNACPLCGGEVVLRLGSSTARSCCIACRWLARPLVQMDNGSLQVQFAATVNA